MDWLSPALTFVVANWQLLTVVALTIAAVVMFVGELLEIELVALLVMAVLLAAGIVSPAEGLRGFSNPATIAIACMFVLSEGLRKTGLVNRMGDLLGTVFTDYDFRFAMIGMMLITGILSGFINNTAVVAIFLPVVLGAVRQTEICPTKVLMALSFSAMFGGVCTLIGTSTNLLVSSIVVDHHMEPIGMFEMAPLGVLFFVVGTFYMLTIGDRLVPEREAKEDLTDSFEMGDYLTEVVIQPQKSPTYKPVSHSYIEQQEDLDILEVIRQGESIPPADAALDLEPFDVVRVCGSAGAIRRLAERDGLAIKPETELGDRQITAGETELFEAVVAPDSMLEGNSLNELDFDETFTAEILAIRRHGETIHRDLMNEPLRGGDALLVRAPVDRISQLHQHPAFVVISELGLTRFATDKMVPALGIIAAVVVLAAFNILPIVVSALVGSLAMVLGGILTPKDAYNAINWQVILLLAGLIPLGVALENTGGIEILSDWMLNVAGGWGPHAMLALFYLITVLLTGIMSNQATAILFTPLAIESAHAMGLDPRPFVLAVTFAASASFLTPVGYQTNTLIYGAGEYEFRDFVEVGTPLTLLFWGVATLFIPIFWPF